MRILANVLVALLALSACGPAVPGDVAVSRGKTNRGWLENGTPLPDRGPGYVRARPGESTRFGLPRLVATIEGSAASVAERFPGSAPLRVGDLSAPFGGRHSRHGSHRSGRDVDLIFYATDAMGRPVRGRGWIAYDRFGVGAEPDSRGGEVAFFDTARNWHLVRELIMNDDASVQWIFVSRGLKARLLSYAIEHEPDAEAIFRATWILHQPSRGNPHADHFHVRIACGATQRALGCRERGPVWSWWHDVQAKRLSYAPFSDEGLLENLLAEAGEEEGAAAARERFASDS